MIRRHPDVARTLAAYDSATLPDIKGTLEMAFFTNLLKRITNRNESSARPVDTSLYNFSGTVGNGLMSQTADASRGPTNTGANERVPDPRRVGYHGIPAPDRATDYSKAAPAPAKRAPEFDPMQELERRQVEQMREIAQREIAQRENARASGVYGVMTAVERAAPKPGERSNADDRASGVYGQMLTVRPGLRQGES